MYTEDTSLPSSNGIFSRIVGWFMSSWNPYSENEVQILQNRIQNRQYGIHLTWKALPSITIADEMETLLDTIVNITDMPKENNTKDLQSADNCSGMIHTNNKTDLGSLKSNRSHQCEHLEEKVDGTFNLHSLLTTFDKIKFPKELSNEEENCSIIDVESDINILDNYYDVDDLYIDQNSETQTKVMDANTCTSKNCSASKIQYIDADINTSANDDDKDIKLKNEIQSKNQSQCNVETHEQIEDKNHENGEDKSNKTPEQRDKRTPKVEEQSYKKEREIGEDEVKSAEKVGISEENVRNAEKQDDGQSLEKPSNSVCAEKENNRRDVLGSKDTSEHIRNEDIPTVEYDSNDIANDIRTEEQTESSMADANVTNSDTKNLDKDVDVEGKEETYEDKADLEVVESEQIIESTATSSIGTEDTAEVEDTQVTEIEHIIENTATTSMGTEDTAELEDTQVTKSEKTNETKCTISDSLTEVLVTRTEHTNEGSVSLTDVHVDDNKETKEATTNLEETHVTKIEQTIQTATSDSLTDVIVTSSYQIQEDSTSLTDVCVSRSKETKEDTGSLTDDYVTGSEDDADKLKEIQVKRCEETEERTSSLTDVEIPDKDKEEICSSHEIDKKKTKSVTWKKSFTSADGQPGGRSSDSDTSQIPGPSSVNPISDTETSSEEVLTENDLAFGNEGLAHYELFVKIEKSVEIQDINEERHRIKDLYKWRVEKINDIMKIAKAYYLNPTGKAVDDWKDLKRGMKLEKKTRSHTDVKIKLAKLPEFLPYFTIFITLAQFIACGVLCILGGLTTIGIEPSIDNQVGIQTFLGTETVHRWIIPNLWIGPSDKYIISVGAFFAPCLRGDIELHLLTIQQNYSKTEPLGCCEMSSRNTAATTTQSECQDLTHGVGIWKPTVKCSERLPGHNSVSHNLKPCCYNNKGQCKLTTHKHCVFLEGYYFKHSEEHCSQVNCLSSVCSMGGFKQKADLPWLPDNPAQWWRLPLSIIYHHGILHVVLVGILHFVLMRIMERSIGWLRIIIVYMLSGVGGNLAASIFEPNSPQVGATGSIFGLLGVTIIEILLLWKFIKSPKLELVKVLLVIIIFLFTGTLRYISNYKIITGLLIGMCSGVIVLPYVTFSKMSHRSRVILVALCTPLLVLIFFVLLYIFVKVQSISDCYVCKLINCVPYTENMCREAYEE